jgi:hypothetical protein
MLERRMTHTAAGVIAWVTRARTVPTRNAGCPIAFRIFQTSNGGEQMEYLIVIGVVAMMALYAMIIDGCLKQPEW